MILDMPTTLSPVPEGQEWIIDMINAILIEGMASMAEQERLRTLSRQAEGIAAAKLQGKHLGRPKIEVPNGWNEIYELWKSGSITAVEAMKKSGLKKSSFYKLVKITEACPPEQGNKVIVLYSLHFLLNISFAPNMAICSYSGFWSKWVSAILSSCCQIQRF